MQNDREILVEKLQDWAVSLEAFRLPAWEELPDFGLYMDQVIAILNRYLDALPAVDASISASTINNYVRLRVMPAPYKKKYSRIHLAYLLMICTLKQGMGIAGIRQILPADLSEEKMHRFYDQYTHHHSDVRQLFLRQVEELAHALLGTNMDNDTVLASLAASAAVTAGLAQTLAESLVSSLPD